MRNLIVVAVLVAGCLAVPQIPKVKQYQNYQYIPSQAQQYVQPAVGAYQPSVHFVQQPAYRYNQYIEPTVKYHEQPQIHARAVPIAILRHSSDFNFDGNFAYDFQTENGITSEASGLVKNFGTKDATNVMRGSYTYTAPDGTPITTNWVADEFGFRAEGDHLPTEPPMPEAIARSLEYIRSLPPSKEEVISQ